VRCASNWHWRCQLPADTLTPATAQPPAAFIARLSGDALLAAAACARATDSETTARLLYHAWWLPYSPHWQAQFPDDNAVLDFVTADPLAKQVLAGSWLRSADPHWWFWHGKQPPTDGKGWYKVYLSVLPEAMPEAFRLAVTAFRTHRVASFKLARQPRSFPRPDRVVAYCASREQAFALLTELGEATAGLPAHGVPFTAAAPASAAVSWARDPVPPVAAYGGSWRRWVTRKLAGYLHASDAPTAQARARWAELRLGEDGVDTALWAPRAELWSAPVAEP
jgi:hypothetical protein